ncbi:alpha-galactosidase [Cryptosporangium arvum DSM 44712]|uniref:Alpha-galactosidase n=1 Tax=Cryptosporangium arvum DSM 44712 TaxID=927661 RepID=A0A010Z5E0_9ACTN|nr:alpha-galactosidase [Cryptosporangium arvum DSM 44712]
MRPDRDRPFVDVAELVGDPSRARVYEHGWQSWSPTGIYPATGTSQRPADATAQTMVYRPGRPAPARGFQGEGLIAVQPAPHAPVHIWSSSAPERTVPSIRVRAERDRLVVSADSEVTVSVHDTGLGTALARWAESLAVRLGVGPVRPTPPVWCSWYCYWEAVTAEAVLANLDAIVDARLPVEVIQVDDGWEAGIGEWRAGGDWAGSLTGVAARVRDAGLRPGLWLAPFLVGARCTLAADHPDWLVGGADAGHNWGQDLAVLDITRPAAAEHLTGMLRALADAGFDYFKLDFLYAGALAGRRYADCSPEAAYREGLELIRAALPEGTTLVGCGAPLLPSIGLVDAMRVGPDVAGEGARETPERRPAAIRTGSARSFQHARWWVNDPDCLLLRPEVPDREEWAGYVSSSGGVAGFSDPVWQLDEWGLDTARRLLRPSSTEHVDLV